MKIKIFSQYFYPENFRINELVSYLKKKGHTLEVVTSIPTYPKRKYFKKYYNNPQKFRLYKNIKIKRLYAFPRLGDNFSLILNYLTFFLSLVFEALLFSKKKEDIYFIFCPSPILIFLPIIFLSKITKTKIILWVLDLWPETLKDLGLVKNSNVLKYFYKIVKYIYDSSSLILVQSGSFKQQISKISKSTTNIFYSWPEQIKKKRKKFPPGMKKKKDYIYIVFAGNIGQAQSFESVVKCAKLLHINKTKVIWVIVGDGRWKSKLQILINEEKLSHMFELVKNVPLNKINTYFNYADALFLSLKKKEVFKKTIPGKLQTYLSYGKPILGMISGEANKIIKKSNSGYAVEADDYRNLKKKIIKFISLSRKKKAQLSFNAKQYAKINYNKNKILNELELKMKTIVEK